MVFLTSHQDDFATCRGFKCQRCPLVAVRPNYSQQKRRETCTTFDNMTLANMRYQLIRIQWCVKPWHALTRLLATYEVKKRKVWRCRYCIHVSAENPTVVSVLMLWRAVWQPVDWVKCLTQRRRPDVHPLQSILFLKFTASVHPTCRARFDTGTQKAEGWRRSPYLHQNKYLLAF